MRPYFDRTLVADFPMLYAQRDGDLRETCMCWGFDVGDGWERIIRNLSVELEFLNETVPGLFIEAVQVKEKFGGLRFYAVVNCTDRATRKFWADIVWALTDNAEHRSLWTCETCGKSGRLRPGGWMVTLCDECAAARNTAGGV